MRPYGEMRPGPRQPVFFAARSAGAGLGASAICTVSGAMVTLPRAAQHLQPLCAIYQRAFAAVAEESLRNGRNKIDSLFGMVRACVIEEEELIRGGFSSAIFRNLNTPDDLEKARSSQIEHRAE